MRADLRKLLARLRVGLIGRDALVSAVETACGVLVTERLDGDAGFRESSRFARPFLSRFEEEISRALLWAPAGEAGRAVRAVEGAARALGHAERIARAHAAWETCRQEWQELRERTGLDRLPGFPTGRTVETVLALAESALARGESRKACSLIIQGRSALRRLEATDSDAAHRQHLVRRIGAGVPPGPEVVRLLERWVSEGRLALAEQVWVDAAIGAEAHIGVSARPGAFAHHRQALERLREAEREACALAPILAAIGGSPVPRGDNLDHQRGDRL